MNSFQLSIYKEKAAAGIRTGRCTLLILLVHLKPVKRGSVFKELNEAVKK